MRQEVFYFPHENHLGNAAPSVEMKDEPTRVWTLFWNDPDKPPGLPIKPIHHQNAFLEDRVHDWNWDRGKFRYGSRVTKGKVWLLLEYDDG